MSKSFEGERAETPCHTAGFEGNGRRSGYTSTPYSLLPTPQSLLPTPYSLPLTPYSLLPTPYSLHPAPPPRSFDGQDIRRNTDDIQPGRPRSPDVWLWCRADLH